jgi:hypothetical protein
LPSRTNTTPCDGQLAHEQAQFEHVAAQLVVTRRRARGRRRCQRGLDARQRIGGADRLRIALQHLAHERAQALAGFAGTRQQGLIFRVRHAGLDELVLHDVSPFDSMGY